MRKIIGVILFLTACNTHDMNFDSYLHQYWLLNDNTIIDIYRLSDTDAKELILNANQKSETDSFTIGDYIVINGQESPSLVHLDDIKKVSDVGIQPTSTFFKFEKDGSNFLKRRFDHQKDFLNHEELSLQYDAESLVDLEKHFYQNKPSIYDLEKNFLGILAFCGEYMCDKLSGDWKLIYPNNDSLNWYPTIEVGDDVYDVFRNFTEGLLEFPDGDFAQIILQDSILFEEPKEVFREINGFPSSHKEVYQTLNKQALMALKESQPNWTLLEEQPEDKNLSVWELENGNVLLSDRLLSKGLIFKSRSDYTLFKSTFDQ